jgi:hypothetical protein
MNNIILYLEDVKRRVGGRTDATSRRKCTFTYNVQHVGKRMRVCLKSLCSYLGITPGVVQTVQNKMKSDAPMNKMQGIHFNPPHRIPDSTTA